MELLLCSVKLMQSYVNISAQLLKSTIVEQYKIIYFLWFRWGKTLWDSQKNVSTIWRKLNYTKKDSDGWKRSKMVEQTSLMKIAGAHLTISWTADNAEQVNALIYGNRLVTVTDIAKKLDICCGSAYSTTYGNLRYHKTCARWTPKHLTISRDMSGNTGMCVKHACDFCSDIMKGRFLCSGLS